MMRLTRAVPPIHLADANHAKIAALDALVAAYLRLCQQYTTYFCTEAQPDKYAAPCFDSPLSQRWQRVAIQHAAGIAQSWRSNYAAAYLSPPEDPALEGGGGRALSLAVCSTAGLPQGLRESTPVERGRHPRPP